MSPIFSIQIYEINLACSNVLLFKNVILNSDKMGQKATKWKNVFDLIFCYISSKGIDVAVGNILLF